MSDVINKTTLEFKKSVNTPDFPTAQWIINPDLSLLINIILKVYWKIVGVTVVEMTQPEKDAVDAAILAAKQAAEKDLITDFVYRKGIDLPVASMSPSALDITSSFGVLITDDVYNVTADPTDKKFIRMSLVLNETTQDVYFVAMERTTGLYGDLDPDEISIIPVKEYSVVAAGSTLIEEIDFLI